MAVASILAALYLFSSFRSVPVNVDAGFFISISRDVLGGATPTLDVSSSYTPGIYYTTALLMKLFDSQYSTILLMAYLVQIGNSILLFFILSHFIQGRAVRFYACLSYYYSHMLLGGLYFVLEPFEVFFILLAVLLNLSTVRTLCKLPLVGLCLGCSIMYKQYSVLALISVCLVTWLEYRSMRFGWSAFLRLLLIPISAALPFLLFVTLTKATLMGSLYSFGFMGNKALSYASGGIIFSKTLKGIIVKIVSMNWLYIPVIAAVFLRYVHKVKFYLDPLIPSLFGFFLLPQFIRQYTHYYQLIAPWAFIIGAVMVDRIIAGGETFQRAKRDFLLSEALTFFVIVPLFLAFSPPFYVVTTPSTLKVLTTFLFLLCVGLVAAAGLHLRRTANTYKIMVLVLMVLLFFETLFLSLKLPLRDYREKKAAQQFEAAEVNKVFPRGSKVYIVDYPQLYYTCDFINPTGYYGFPLTEAKAASLEWAKIDKLILRGESRVLTQQMLQERGFRQLIRIPEFYLSLYSRETSRYDAHRR